MNITRTPRSADEVDGLVAEAERQLDEIESLVCPLSEEALLRRPNERKWSVMGHIAHLCLTNGPYLDVMEARMKEVRGFDLGRIRFSSPFLALLRMSLGTAQATLLAHNRRHIRLLREVLDWDGFPGGGVGDESG